MSEWREVALSDLLTFGNGKRKPSTSGNIPIYGGNGVLGFSNDSNYQDETIVIGRVGAYCGSVYYETKPIWVSDNALSAKPKSDNNLKFLYYFLKQVELNQYAGGSSHPLVTQTLLNSLEFDVCTNPSEQKAIAEVLSSLDDKIDLLHRQNKTLQQMAETLFRQWFMEEAQEDWEDVTISQFVSLNPKSITKEYSISNIEYLDTGSLTEGHFGEFQSYQLDVAPSRAKRLVQHNDILISTVRPNQKHYGIVKEPIENLVVSTGFCVVTCITIDPHFIYLLLTNDEMTEYLHSIAEGSTSTYPSLKPVDIGAIEFKLPPEYLLSGFSEVANSAWEKIQKNYKQVRILESLRDTLLPKLMSGDVRIASHG